MDRLSHKHPCLGELSSMIFSKELTLRIPHLRVNWFSFKLLYLKILIRIFGLMSRLKNKFPYWERRRAQYVNGCRTDAVDRTIR